MKKHASRRRLTKAQRKEYFDMLKLANKLLDFEEEGQRSPVFDGGIHSELTAEEILQHAIYLYPDEPLAYIGLANVYKTWQNFVEALPLLQRATSLEPTNALFHAHHADCLLGLEDWSAALAECEQALLCDPQFTSALFQKGVALQNLRRYREAIVCLSIAFEEHPEETWPRIELARCNFYIGRFEVAQSHLEFSLIFEPENPIALLYAGKCCFQRKNYPVAKAYLKRAEAAGVCSTDLFILLGKCDVVSKEMLGAAHQFGKAVQLDLDDFESNACLGIALVHLENWAEAKKVLERADQINPDHQKVLDNLLQCYFNLNDEENVALLLYRMEELDRSAL